MPRFGIHGDGKCPADEPAGSCLVRFFAPIAPWPRSSNYQIVDTDYDNYTIVYACELNFQYLWIMSRTPTITEDFEQELLSKAFAYLPNYETSNLIKDDQNPDRCTYWKKDTYQDNKKFALNRSTIFTLNYTKVSSVYSDLFLTYPIYFNL